MTDGIEAITHNEDLGILLTILPLNTQLSIVSVPTQIH